MAATTQEQNDFLKSTFPVYFPAHPALAYNATEFTAFLEKDVHKFQPTTSNQESGSQVLGPVDDATTLASEPSATTTGEVREALKDMGIEQKESPAGQHPFMEAIQDSSNEPNRDMENVMQTENADLAHRSTTEPLC